MTLYIGLTGNMGSGKSTVCRVFEAIGIPVYYSDKRAKHFLDYPDVKSDIIKKFDISSTTETNSLDRKNLAELVFNDPEKLHFLNSLIHPKVIEDYNKWKEKNITAQYTILESAIIFESGLEKMFDKIIYVRCDEDIRMERIMQRDGISKEEILKRFRNQMPDVIKAGISDIIIDNKCSFALIPQILSIHELLMGSGTT